MQDTCVHVRVFNSEYNAYFLECVWLDFPQVNNNGDVSFSVNYPEYDPKPFPISVPIIAPFWADVDTRCNGSGDVYFRETTSNAIRAKAARDIQSSLSLENAFYPSSVIIATWDQVGYYSCRDKTDNKVKTLNAFCKHQLTISAEIANWTKSFTKWKAHLFSLFI